MMGGRRNSRNISSLNPIHCLQCKRTYTHACTQARTHTPTHVHTYIGTQARIQTRCCWSECITKGEAVKVVEEQERDEMAEG